MPMSPAPRLLTALLLAAAGPASGATATSPIGHLQGDGPRSPLVGEPVVVTWTVAAWPRASVVVAALVIAGGSTTVSVNVWSTWPASFVARRVTG